MHVLVSNSFLLTLWTLNLLQYQKLILKISKAMHISVSDFLVSNLWTLNFFVIRKLIDDHKEMSVKILPISAETHWRSRKKHQ
jgi:hypothetical protein